MLAPNWSGVQRFSFSKTILFQNFRGMRLAVVDQRIRSDAKTGVLRVSFVRFRVLGGYFGAIQPGEGSCVRSSQTRCRSAREIPSTPLRAGSSLRLKDGWEWKH
jgi:hypothetical protein